MGFCPTMMGTEVGLLSLAASAMVMMGGGVVRSSWEGAEMKMAGGWGVESHPTEDSLLESGGRAACTEVEAQCMIWGSDG